jgi:hypothetical protein
VSAGALLLDALGYFTSNGNCSDDGTAFLYQAKGHLDVKFWPGLVLRESHNWGGLGAS